MKGKLAYLAIAAALYVLFHFINGNLILRSTQQLVELEKTAKAEKNIQTELTIEHDNLVSNQNISLMVADKMSKSMPQNAAGNVVYIQEPAVEKTPTYYCIIDLLTPKIEASSIQPD